MLKFYTRERKCFVGLGAKYYNSEYLNFFKRITQYFSYEKLGRFTLFQITIGKRH